MKVLLALLMVLFMVSIAVAQSAELPEPTAPTIAYSYQIAWGNRVPGTPLTYTAIIPKSATMGSGTVAVNHVYSGIIGDNKWEFETLDSTVASPKKMSVVLTLTSIPGAKWFDIYRFRVGVNVVYPDATVSPIIWSDDSYWVLVVDLTKLKPKSSVGIR